METKNIWRHEHEEVYKNKAHQESDGKCVNLFANADKENEQKEDNPLSKSFERIALDRHLTDEAKMHEVDRVIMPLLTAVVKVKTSGLFAETIVKKLSAKSAFMSRAEELVNEFNASVDAGFDIFIDYIGTSIESREIMLEAFGDYVDYVDEYAKECDEIMHALSDFIDTVAKANPKFSPDQLTIDPSLLQKDGMTVEDFVIEFFKLYIEIESRRQVVRDAARNMHGDQSVSEHWFLQMFNASSEYQKEEILSGAYYVLLVLADESNPYDEDFRNDVDAVSVILKCVREFVAEYRDIDRCLTVEETE